MPYRFRSLPRASLLMSPLFLLLGASAGCDSDASSDEDGNVLPTASGGDASGDTANDSEGEGESESEGAGPTEFPASYRFDCIDIRVLGSDGTGESIQANTLNQAWGSDINLFRLNIIADILSRDAETGEGTLQIRSGVGTNNADQCSPSDSASEVHAVAYQPDSTAYAPASEGCAMEATTGDDVGGTYFFETGPDDLFWIYAENDDGVTYNCTVDASTPDAVPLRNVSATFTTNTNENQAWGYLQGCLLESEAEALCSCIGTCGPTTGEGCGGCPNEGSVPLRTLLGNLEASEPCTTALGAPAFDLGIAFSLGVMPSIPMTCG